MRRRTPSSKGPCVTPGRPAGGANVVGGFDASAVPASPAAVSVGRHVLLYCNSYRNTLHRSDRCSAGHFGMRQSPAVAEFGSRLRVEPSFRSVPITSVHDVM